MDGVDAGFCCPSICFGLGQQKSLWGYLGRVRPVVFVETVTALIEGSGKQRHWCRYSNCSMRFRLNGVGGLLFLQQFKWRVAGFVLGALAGFHR